MNELWMLGGGALGALLGAYTQKKANKTMGAVAGAGLGALAGLALKYQISAVRTGATVAAGAISAGAPAAIQGAQQAWDGLDRAPSSAQLPAGKMSVPWQAMTPQSKGDAGYASSAGSVERLLDDAGFMSDDPETYTSLLQPMPEL